MSENIDKHLEQELADLQTSSVAFAQRFINDSKLRQHYIQSTKDFSDELIEKVKRNQMSPEVAAKQAHSMRNTIMNAMRGKTSDFGLALVRFLKKEGKTLQELERKYSHELFKKDMTALNNAQRGDIWRKIIAKSGEPQLRVSNSAKWMGRMGRGLFFLTAAIAIFHIAKAENKVRATANELTALGGGFAGSAALGTAGLVCGPAALFCVPLGIFIGGVAGAFGADWAFDKIWR